MFTDWKKTQPATGTANAQKNNFQKELDYNQFLFDELNELVLKENELEDLDSELQILSNAEEIKNAFNTAVYELKESEQPIVQSIKQMINKLNAFASFQYKFKRIDQTVCKVRRLNWQI